MAKNFQQLLPNLWLFSDTCNVYVLKNGRSAVAVDFGSGKWLRALPALGIDRLDHAFLTHHHADQCAGLETRRRWPFMIHAPADEATFLDPGQLRGYRQAVRRLAYQTFPRSYQPLTSGLAAVAYDMRANSEWYGQGLCLRFIHTPGHGPNACSIVVEFQGRQICFCGDAVHSGSRIWQPFNLEWDHWTGAGALAAWEGIQRLRGVGLDWLCPAHGPVITAHPSRVLRTLAVRLMRLYRAKGSICAGEKDHFLMPEPFTNAAWRCLPHLYRFGRNSYLLVSASGQTLIVDPTRAPSPALDEIVRALGVRTPAVAVATHIHSDHCGVLAKFRQHYGTRICLHPRLAEALRQTGRRFYLLAPARSIRPDEIWPERGTWRWQEYEFTVAPWPGQTWWHCAFMTRIDGQKVLFGGDSFQPASRWNGTGGFCALNNSRFREGYIPSARLALRWRPDILANGHGAVFRYTASRFRRIIRWARLAEKAVRDLCPSGDLERDYYAVTVPAGAGARRPAGRR